MHAKHAYGFNISNEERIKSWTIWATVAYVTAFGFASAFSYLNNSGFEAVQGIFYIIAVTSAVIACLWASKHSDIHRRLWQMLSIGMLSWLASVSVSAYYMIQVGPKNIPSPNLADVFIVAFVPIIFGIMISIAKINRPLDTVKKRIIVNIAMAALAMFLFCFEFVLMPLWQSETGISLWQKIFTIVYPMFDWILLTTLLFASYNLVEKNTEGWLVYLFSAFAVSVIADLPTYLLGYQMSFPFIVLSITGAILIVYSAIDEISGSLGGVWRRSTGKYSSRRSSKLSDIWQTVIMPSATIFSVPFIWVASVYPDLSVEVSVLAGVSTIIIGLLIYRNHLLVSENTVLFLKTLRDGLTGLNNHRYFQEVLDKLILKAKKTDKPLSLILIDIDNFSKFNSKYGHITGDRVLTSTAQTLSIGIRDTDEACRLSGDEFAIILPKTDKNEALKAARLIIERIKDRLSDELPGKEIGISAGISSYPSLSSSKEELLATADGALYWTKLDRGDSILLYDPEIVEAMSAEERSSKLEEVASLDMVRSLARAVDARDPYTRLHSKRVGYLARKIAERMDLDAKTIRIVEIAGILHDVGKIGISDVILNKPDKLNIEEIAAIRTHPELSAQIVSSTSLKEIIPYVRAHHERWDGSGYPDGLKKDEIPLVARILGVADSFDAMTSNRPYRESLELGAAIKEIQRCSGTQFDPEIVSHFLAMYGVTNHNALFEDDSDQDMTFGVAVNF